MGKMKCRVAKEVSHAHLICLIGHSLPREMTRVFIPNYRSVTKFHKFLPVSRYVFRSTAWTMQCWTSTANRPGRRIHLALRELKHLCPSIARSGAEGVCQPEACFMGGWTPPRAVGRDGTEGGRAYALTQHYKFLSERLRKSHYLPYRQNIPWGVFV